MADASGDDTPKKSPRPQNANLSPAWKPGQSGNPKGRPKGARTQLSESFCDALLKDFTDNGVDAIVSMRTDKPNEYAKMIASMLPKEVDASVTGELSDEMREWLGLKI